MSDPLTIIHGDCVEVMRGMDENSVDAIVTDPPYGLTEVPAGTAGGYLRTAADRERRRGGFMGKAWDGTGIAFTVEMWAEALRVLKPGGHLLAFGGTRTFHRMTVAIEDAGFEIRDCLMWLYGSGFPKSLDVSKAMDKAAGAAPIDLGVSPNWRESKRDREKNGQMEVRGENAGRITAPSTDLAKKWQGWGTALKPAFEPIILARKPLIGMVASNVEKHGTGALNIDGSRIGTNGEIVHAPQSDPTKRVGTVGTDLGITRANVDDFQAAQRASVERTNTLGRWPANVLLDEEAAEMLDEQSGERSSGKMRPTHTDAPRSVFGQNAAGGYTTMETYGDRGGASRFFYTAKASKADRGKGNSHPTVKPVDLMRWLVRLVAPPGGLVLDPFAGSGTTGQAALAEGFRCVLIEKEAEYVEGIKKWRAAMQLGTGI